MKKILLIGPNSIHVYNYISLIKPYFEEIVFIADQKNSRFNYQDITLHYASFSVRKPLAFVKSIFFIRKIIAQFKPDIIHTHQLTTHAYQTILANKKTKIPMVFTAWGSDVLLLPHMGFIYKKMNEYILNNARWFTADANYMAEVMQNVAGKKLNILIANFGIDNIAPNHIEKQNIIYSNRQLTKLYRIDKIIEAFARFVNKRPLEQWKLIVGAEGDEKNKLIDLSNQLNISKLIDFTGWLEKEKNLYYYSISKYYVSVPQSDGTSISLLEAMAHGCLPILSNLPANKQWVQHNVNGYIVEDLNSNFIEEATKINFKEACQLNKHIIENDGTKEANSKKFMQFYHEIISN